MLNPARVRSMRIALAVAAFVAAGLVATLITGAASWRRATQRRVEALAATVTPAHPAPAPALDRLPVPAARYFRRSLAGGVRLIRSAMATQQAEFFINGGWRPLTATQHFTVSPPGFVWDARIEMAPLMPARVRDAYVSGRGAMQASIYGLYSIVDLEDTPELNSGALQRFLGETVWFPTALLPSSSISWLPRDDRSAVVTLIDSATRVSLLFEFDAHGDVIHISGDRFKETKGSYVMQPWAIACSDHADRSGVRIPLFCEVAWIGSNGPEPYWRGRISSIEYVFWQ
jgi:hypothetical protein